MEQFGRLRSDFGGLVTALALGLGSWNLVRADAPTSRLELTVDAGRFDRVQTPVQISIQKDEIPQDWADWLDPIATKGGQVTFKDLDNPGQTVVAQVDRPEAQIDHVRLLWILPARTSAGARRTFRLEPGTPPTDPPVVWRFETTSEGHLELFRSDDPVFRYNMAPVRHPDHPNPNQPRSAYIHPAFAPSGALVTGDYSAESHPHHRGFFLAYTKTSVGDLQPDFWNIQNGSGKIHFDRLGPVTTGPVSARFSTFHRWEASRPDNDPVVVLRERWDVEVFDIPGTPYRLFDLTSTQQATETPLVLPPYRYGGMAYRGPDSFLPQGVLDVLTSEGLDRVAGDQQPARWVDLTGPVTEGSDRYAGAAMFDHPTNLHHPTPARIHPTRIPFFCFVPSHDESVTIGTESPVVFRYRVLIHDGHPNEALNERGWRDFAESPTVSLTIRSS
ncbi:DUF6807 domain-containing protein [Tautonia marina]|uniref:DUF6807 domain-containing protein n=1 Tax=Tautonia marina TaxID=2653855 RepID=UPI00126131C5|nr:PmoA family protein [Tautonia marina]